MELIGFVFTCFFGVVYGRYLLGALVQAIIDSPFGFSGERKVLKEKKVQRVIKNIGSPMGIGAGIVAFINGAGWLAVLIFTVTVCLVPGVLFGVLRRLRHAVISLDKRVDAFFSK